MSAYICPNCKKQIHDDDALLCFYCGESLGRNLGFMGKLRHPKYAIISAALITVVLLGFVMLLVR